MQFTQFTTHELKIAYLTVAMLVASHIIVIIIFAHFPNISFDNAFIRKSFIRDRRMAE